MNVSKYVGERIKEFRKSRNMNQEELAELLDTTKQTISRYETGERKISQDTLFKLTEIFDARLDDFFPEPTNAIPVTPETVKIPIIGKIACGNPIDAEENIEDYLYLPADMVPPGENFALIAEGDSMEPEISSGSKVVVRKQEEVENGEIAAVLVNGDTEATLKRVRYQNGHVILTPDNGKYDPMIITENNPARIVGKAVMITKFL